MWNDRLKLVAFCPLCGSRSSKIDACVLGGEGETQLLHVTCRRCSTHILTLTMVGQAGAGAVGLVTDLSAEDAIRLSQTQAISTNDILHMHGLLGGSLASWLPEMPRAQTPKTVRARTKTKMRRTTGTHKGNTAVT